MDILNVERKRELRLLFVPFVATLRPIDCWIEMREATENVSEHFKQQREEHFKKVEELILKFPNKSSFSKEQYRSELQSLPILRLETFGPRTPVECAYVEGMLDSPAYAETKDAYEMADTFARYSKVSGDQAINAIEMAEAANKDCEELKEPAFTEMMNQVRRKAGTKTTHEKSKINHGNILVRANAIDPNRQQSANALSGILVEDLKTHRMTKVKKVGNPDGMKKDTSMRRKGRSKTTICRVLKKNGWN